MNTRRATAEDPQPHGATARASGLAGLLRGWTYDRTLLQLTGEWYGHALSRLPHGARVLDVGIGTAGALLSQADLVRERALEVVGVDVDGDYVRRARVRVAKAGMADRVTVLHEPLEAHAGGPYEAVYFSGSFMLLPEPDRALEHARSLLAPGGVVLFTQTFHHRRGVVLEALKPALKRFIGIDFGRVTYEEDFLETLRRGGLDVVEHAVLKAGRASSARLVVAVPGAAVTR